jgi:hypothetical protein
VVGSALTVKTLKEIRILSKNIAQIRAYCPNVKPSYMVVLKPKVSLPSEAELSINVENSVELEQFLAALVYLSPEARLVGGVGM